METLQRELAEAKSKLSSQNHRMQKLTQELHAHQQTIINAPGKAITPSSRIWPKNREQSKTSPASISVGARYLGDTISFKNKRAEAIAAAGKFKDKHHQPEFSRLRPLSPSKRDAAVVMDEQVWEIKEKAREEERKVRKIIIRKNF